MMNFLQALAGVTSEIHTFLRHHGSRLVEARTVLNGYVFQTAVAGRHSMVTVEENACDTSITKRKSMEAGSVRRRWHTV
jgi:hypothetical protein